MERMHTSAITSHLSTRKLIYSLFAHVWWPKLHASVSKFISACDFWKKPKDSTSLLTGLLHPLPIPTLQFTSWSMDFVTDFPLSQGYNAIFVCMDCLTKYTKLILCSFCRNSQQQSKLHNYFLQCGFASWYSNIFHISEGYLAVILSQAAKKRMWVGYDLA